LRKDHGVNTTFGVDVGTGDELVYYPGVERKDVMAHKHSTGVSAMPITKSVNVIRAENNELIRSDVPKDDKPDASGLEGVCFNVKYPIVVRVFFPI